MLISPVLRLRCEQDIRQRQILYSAIPTLLFPPAPSLDYCCLYLHICIFCNDCCCSSRLRMFFTAKLCCAVNRLEPLHQHIPNSQSITNLVTCARPSGAHAHHFFTSPLLPPAYPSAFLTVNPTKAVVTSSFINFYQHQYYCDNETQPCPSLLQQIITTVRPGHLLADLHPRSLHPVLQGRWELNPR